MVTDESGCLRQTFVIKPVHDLCHGVALYHVPLIAETVIEQVERSVESVGTLTVGQQLRCATADDLGHGTRAGVLFGTDSFFKEF